MRSRYHTYDNESIYFITSTIIHWIPIFTKEKYFQIMIDSLKYCKDNKKLKIYAYVILENHFHMLVSCEKLPDVIRDFKRHTARKIINELKEDRKYEVLENFKYHKKSIKFESTYQVWQEGYMPKIMNSLDKLSTYLNYIHNNPVKKGYVRFQEHWKYSSADSFYNRTKGDIELDEILW